MNDAELNLSNIRSQLFVNKTALDSTQQYWRQLQMFKMIPGSQDESILFAGEDIEDEIERTAKHIVHLMEQIDLADTLMFKHKLMHGED